ncbi:DUF2057 domain-containing protein [Marinobacter sp. ELB17]|uniref:DUF2057 domain-containing protein n=1 Tax=Marinobacter sp. ELB17 TaxID=270374 RepID=UPI0000F36B8D|nr:DUF2057 domain-containing protein [Marinobacter sp. ELB17]EAZ97311.1 hypothetical protein MELB17_11639 [Marinobacter sp. ELB17]
MPGLLPAFLQILTFRLSLNAKCAPGSYESELLEYPLKAIVAPSFLLALFFSAQAPAEVTLALGPCVQVHVINGEEKIVLPESSLTLTNGTQQLVVDCTAMLGRSSDEAFPETGEAFVLLFEAADTKLTLSAPHIQTRQQMKAFNRQRNFGLTSAAGTSLNYYVEVLEKEGFQVFRDFPGELEVFNRTSSPAAIRAQLPGLADADTDIDTAEPSPKAGGQGAQDQETVRQMLRYWYLEADKQTRKEWKNWIQSSN